MSSYLLFLVITVMNLSGGISVETDRFYMRSEYVCERRATELVSANTWTVAVPTSLGTVGIARRNRDMVHSFAKASCLQLGHIEIGDSRRSREQ